MDDNRIDRLHHPIICPDTKALVVAMIHIPLADILAYFLGMVRATVFLFTCPPLTTSAIPFQARVAIAGGLSLAALPVISHEYLITSDIALIGALVTQVILGALIGLVVQLFIGAIQAAGTVIDQFSGLNLPPAIDPLSLDQSPIIAKAYEWTTTMLFFSTGAYILVFKGFEKSFSIFGTTIPLSYFRNISSLITSDMVRFFAATVEIAAPLVAVVFSSQILLGLLAKSAPQANIYALGFPLQIVVIIFTLSLAILALPNDLISLTQKVVSQLFGGP